MMKFFDSLGDKLGISGGMALTVCLIALVCIVAVIIVIVNMSKKGKKQDKTAEKTTTATTTTSAANTAKPAATKTEASEKAETTNEQPKPAAEEKSTTTAEKEATKEEQPKPAAAKTEASKKAETTNEQAKPAEEKKEEEPMKAKETKTEKPATNEKAATAGKQAKPATTKTETKATATTSANKQAKPAATTKRMLGKWRVALKGEGEYLSMLYASNGEVMLTSEIYSTEEGARSGIATIIKGIETGNFVIYRGKGGDYYYKLKSAGNRLLCVGEIYKTKDGCEKAVESVKRIAKDSPILDEVNEGEKFIDYTPAQVVPPQKKAMGKWKIEQAENGGFSAKLYANNGQLMLATEEVAARKTAEKAVESVRKNCADGNFFIDKDKFGRFYYKLHNAQKSVICTGETYDTVDGVVSAIESVRRFASNAEIQN